MKRPTKDQAELTMGLLLIVGALAFSIYQDGIIRTGLWLLSLAVIIAVLFGLLGLARRIGR